MNGYKGNILNVDLSTYKTKVNDLNLNWVYDYIGGKGLGARYLYEELSANTDPLSQRNVLIFMTGPLTGTEAPASSKYVVVTRSPLTGAFLDSYVGGLYPAELKFSGFDGIVIKGRAPKWSYLLVQDGEATIKDAEHIVGMGTQETTKVISEEVGLDNVKVAAIGPAGENLVKISCMISDLRHKAGRGGVGAVMGSKNLKAVAVAGSNRKVELRDEDGFKEAVREITRKEILENPAHDWVRIDGTPAIIRMSNDAGILPTRNFQDGTFEHAENIDAMKVKENLVRRTACYRCPMACRNIIEIREGAQKGLMIEGPEYETLALAGANCGIDDLGTIAKYNDLCDDLGIDTISAGNITAFTMECFEKGLLTKKDVNGLDIRFGSAEGYLEVPMLIAYRKGLGSKLAEGVKTASEMIGKGSQRFAQHVKGLEYPGYDPRGSIGMALAYATSDRGACHLRAWPANSEAFGNLDRFTPQGKAPLVVDEQNKYSVKWSMIFCDFYSIEYPTMARFYRLATGNNIKEDELRRIGERIWNLVRKFNVREGFSRAHDSLPYRIEKDPLRSGIPKGRVVSRKDFETMLDEYYQIRGWTVDGMPTPEKLKELGLYA